MSGEVEQSVGAQNAHLRAALVQQREHIHMIETFLGVLLARAGGDATIEEAEAEAWRDGDRAVQITLEPPLIAVAGQPERRSVRLKVVEAPES